MIENEPNPHFLFLSNHNVKYHWSRSLSSSVQLWTGELLFWFTFNWEKFSQKKLRNCADCSVNSWLLFTFQINQINSRNLQTLFKIDSWGKERSSIYSKWQGWNFTVLVPRFVRNFATKLSSNDYSIQLREFSDFANISINM